MLRWRGDVCGFVLVATPGGRRVELFQAALARAGLRPARVVAWADLLAGTRFPKLKYLGLRDSEMADDIAAVLANAPVLKKVKRLDLSLGTLSDAGARALLGSRAVKKLEMLDVHHHFCSPAVVKQLKALGPKVDASDAQKAEEWDGAPQRFVAVGE